MRTRTRFALATLGFAAGQSFLLGVPSCAQDKAADAPSKNSNAAAGSQSSLRDVAAELTKKLHDDADVKKLKEQRLVIAEFENINGKGDAVPRILQEMLTTAFIKAKHFKVVERKQLDKALEELHFTLSDLTDPDKRKQIGKLVNASYLLIGSIADTGDSTTINTRVVAIESGENIAAEDAIIKQSETSTPADANPRPMPANDAPKIKVPEKAVSNSAGQYTGKQADFGLFGVAKYQIAWEEKLGTLPVLAFSAGEVQGHGVHRLILAVRKYEARDLCNLRVMKWENGRFRQTWESEAYDFHENVYVRVATFNPNAAPFIVSDGSIEHVPIEPMMFRWNGTTYNKEVLPVSHPPVVTDVISQPSMVEVVGIYKSHVSATQFSGGISPSSDNIEVQVPYKYSHVSPVIKADFDGDNQAEFATFAFLSNNGSKPIVVYTLGDVLKAQTSESYDVRLLTHWLPHNIKLPYIVATRCTKDEETGKPNGGYVCFVQWDGESYKEVFKSNKLHDAIIDVQVCDPKGEGTTGLVVLSADKKGYYLTKIVPEK